MITIYQGGGVVNASHSPAHFASRQGVTKPSDEFFLLGVIISSYLDILLIRYA